MKYFFLKAAIETKQIGRAFPQVKQIQYFGRKDWDRVYSDAILGKVDWARLYPEGMRTQVPADTVPFEPTVEKSAKLTDCLSTNYTLFMFVSQKFLDTLYRFRLGTFQSWRLVVHHKGQAFDHYGIFHSCTPVNDGVVLYEQSEFEVARVTDWQRMHPRQKVSLGNAAAYRELHDALSATDARKGIMSPKLVLDLRQVGLDLFRLYYPYIGGFIVSEQLKEAIEAAGLTGVMFKPLETDERLEVLYG